MSGKCKARPGRFQPLRILMFLSLLISTSHSHKRIFRASGFIIALGNMKVRFRNIGGNQEKLYEFPTCISLLYPEVNIPPDTPSLDTGV